MPKIYVAYQTAGPAIGQRLASGSITTLKTRMRPIPASEWTVATYDLKPTVKTLCVVIENIVEMEHEVLEKMAVNEAGQVRKVV
jgi:hypothetical protein